MTPSNRLYREQRNALTKSTTCTPKITYIKLATNEGTVEKSSEFLLDCFCTKHAFVTLPSSPFLQP